LIVPCCEERIAVLKNLVKMLVLGLVSGFLSACAWNLLLVPGKRHHLGLLLLDLFLFLLPGVIYGLAISFNFFDGVSSGKFVRMVQTAISGGLSFVFALLATVRGYAALSWAALLLGGFVGSLTFGLIVCLLRSTHSPWGLASFVFSRTLAALVFFPFSSQVAKGSNVTSARSSVYLGFMVWQGATAAELALSQPASDSENRESEEV
jgi:hypothetical protein